MFKRPKLKWLLLALVAVSSVAMVACGSGTDESTGSAPAAQAQDRSGDDIDAETLAAAVATAVAAALKTDIQTAPATEAETANVKQAEDSAPEVTSIGV